MSKKVWLLCGVLFCLMGLFFIYQWKIYRGSIVPYNSSRDRASLISMYRKNLYWLTYRNDEEEAIAAFSYQLDNLSSSNHACDNGKLTILVYRAHGKTVGFIAYYLVGFLRVKILFIAVHNDYRRKGYATKLMSDALIRFKKQGFCGVELATRVSNSYGQGLYKKFGFEVRRVDDGFVQFEKSLR